jgi:hypothetical protein
MKTVVGTLLAIAALFVGIGLALNGMGVLHLSSSSRPSVATQAPPSSSTTATEDRIGEAASAASDTCAGLGAVAHALATMGYGSQTTQLAASVEVGARFAADHDVKWQELALVAELIATDVAAQRGGAAELEVQRALGGPCAGVPAPRN